jgi:hypothetical protein
MKTAIAMLLGVMLTGCASQRGAMTCAVGDVNATKGNCGCACPVAR